MCSGDLTNSTYEKLKPKMLVDQTMYYENYPRLNYEISSEEQVLKGLSAPRNRY